jgi:hypothetical protein
MFHYLNTDPASILAVIIIITVTKIIIFISRNFLTAENFPQPKGLCDHTIRRTVGLFWPSDQPVAEASTYTGQHNI